jgi:hypothetical protein
VLRRKCSLPDWVSFTTVELEERNEDLTAKEASMLEFQDALMVVEGRLKRISYPNATADEETLPRRSCHTRVRSVGALAVRPLAGTARQNRFKISPRDLVDMCMKSCHDDTLLPEASSDVGEYIAEGPAHAEAVIKAALNHLWTSYESYWKANVPQIHVSPYPGSERLLLYRLKKGMASNALDMIVKNYCTEKIANWNALFDLSVIAHDNLILVGWTKDQSVQDLPASILNMVTATRLTRYIIDTKLVNERVLSTAIFDKFWWKLKDVFRFMWSATTPGCNNRLVTVLKLLGDSVFFKSQASDFFYKHVKSLCDEATGSKTYTVFSAIAVCLKSSVRIHVWFGGFPY